MYVQSAYPADVYGEEHQTHNVEDESKQKRAQHHKSPGENIK